MAPRERSNIKGGSRTQGKAPRRPRPPQR